MGSYYNPVRTYFGPGQKRVLSNIIEELNMQQKDILFLTRGGDFNKTGEYGEIKNDLAACKINEEGYCKSNPDIKHVYELYNRLKSIDYQLVVAVGGGSVLDIGKTLAGVKGLELNSPRQLRELISSKRVNRNKRACKWVGLPTTSGTGSEVTPWAAIWDREKGLKYSIEGKNLFAYAAVVDPELTVKLPVRASVSTALDALCHATEAYWANRTNEISRNFSLTAIGKIIHHVKRIMDAPDDINTRERLAMGSLYAGLAFSNTKTTACHSISYPLTNTTLKLNSPTFRIFHPTMRFKNINSIFNS